MSGVDMCEKYTELISAKLDGELSGAEELALEAHLASCPACRALAEELAAIHAAFPRLGEYQAPEGFARGVMDKIQEREGQKPKVVPLFKRPQIKALAGLAACAVLCVGLYQGVQMRDDPQVNARVTVNAQQEEGPAVGPAQFALDVPGTADGALEKQPRSEDTLQKAVAEAVLTLAALPEGAGLDEQWLADEEGRAFHIVTAEQVEALSALAQDQGIDLSLTGDPGDAERCILIIAED